MDLPPLKKKRTSTKPAPRPKQNQAYRQQVAYQQQLHAHQAAVQKQQAAQVRAHEEGPKEEVEEDKSKHKTSYETHRFLYWSGLLFLSIMNFIICFIFIPITILIRGWSAYVIVLVLGGLFGLIFDYLIRDLEHMEKRHSLFAAILIPILAIIDLFVINILAPTVGDVLEVSLAQNPMVIGSMYLLAFLGPFTYSYLITGEIQ